MDHSNDSSTILVAGATGFLGGEICRQLIKKGNNVKGLVRTTSDANKVDQLKTFGVEIVEGDVKDATSLENTLKGVAAVITTVNSVASRQEGDSIQTVDYEGQCNLIDAAKAAGVNHFVYISFCPMPEDFPLQTAKRNVEKHLVQSRLNYTILQPTCFMEIWLGPHTGFNYSEGKATIYGEGRNKLSWISLKDVAAFAVASLAPSIIESSIIKLGGPEALSPLEVVEIFESKMGKKFELQFVSVEDLHAQKENAPDPLSESFAALMLIVANGSEIDMKDIPDVFEVRLTSVKEYAERVVAI